MFCSLQPYKKNSMEGYLLISYRGQIKCCNKNYIYLLRGEDGKKAQTTKALTCVAEMRYRVTSLTFTCWQRPTPLSIPLTMT